MIPETERELIIGLLLHLDSIADEYCPYCYRFNGHEKWCVWKEIAATFGTKNDWQEIVAILQRKRGKTDCGINRQILQLQRKREKGLTK